MSHTLKRNLTKLVYVQKEKNWKLKIFISSLFKKKNEEIWNVNSNMVYVKKTIFFDFKKKRYSETLKKNMYLSQSTI